MRLLHNYIMYYASKRIIEKNLTDHYSQITFL